MSLHKKTIFTGAATALITPFLNGRIDYEAFGALIDTQIQSGIHALLVAGTTGEGSALSMEEHRELISYAHDRIAGRVPLLAGCGSNVTSRAIALAEGACAAGADALLVVTPYYNKASDRGLVLHYSAIADSVDRPLILYSVPSRTGVKLMMEHYRALAEHENIVGVKEASGDLELVANLCAECGDELDIYTGNDHQTVPTMQLGGRGVISVCSNLLPRAMVELCRLCSEGQYQKAHAAQRTLLPKMQLLFREVNPIPVKYAASVRGICAAEYRLPLCAPSPEFARALQSEFCK